MATEKRSKTLQEYIDERPNWSDGTLVPSTPLTTMQHLNSSNLVPMPADEPLRRGSVMGSAGPLRSRP
jgi:hypothetical protein